MLDLHYLKLFHVVAQNQSFTKASEILHITQPALSIQIKKLEEGLGMKLFDKTGNKIQLNANGTLLLSYTKQIFELIDEATHKLVDESQLIQGEINIGGSNTPGTYILPKIIGRFKEKYPYVKINLKIGTTEEIAYLVTTGNIDIAINGGYIDYGNAIESLKLMDDEIILAASKTSELEANVTAEALGKANFIIHDTNSQLYKVVKDFLKTKDIERECTLAFNTIDAIKQAVAANLGVSLIPKVALELELELGMIKQLYIGEPQSYPYYLIYNKYKYLSPAKKKFIQCIQTFFEQ
ncbi:MAG: LysR family transcriptional regulator [Cellulosilyticaceae bacterium]